MIPLLAGLATGFAFIPPSAGSVLVANMLNVDLGVMIAVGVPVGILSLIFAGIYGQNLSAVKLMQGFLQISRKFGKPKKVIFRSFLPCYALFLYRWY